MRQWIFENIPDIFEKEGTTIYEGRNEIKILLPADGTSRECEEISCSSWSKTNCGIFMGNSPQPFKGQRAFLNIVI